MRIIIDQFRELRIWLSQLTDAAAIGLAGEGFYGSAPAFDALSDTAEGDDLEREWRRREQEWMALSPWWM
jgi:hypothetical protein